MLKHWIIKFLSVAVLGVSSVGFSCGDYCGDYGAAYDVGGYNLYSFTIDISTYTDYANTDSNWGGSCGSFSGSCGSGYDAGYSLGCDTSGIDLQIAYLSNQLNSYLYTNPLLNNAAYSPYGGGGGFGTIPGLNYGYLPPTYTGGNFYPGPTVPQYPVSNPFPTSFPQNSFPSNPYYGGPVTPPMTPPSSTFPTVPTTSTNSGGFSIPPSVRAPYSGCDNITILCPGGPITRPIDLKQPPVYQPVTTQTGNDPLRYRVPRGVVTH